MSEARLAVSISADVPLAGRIRAAVPLSGSVTGGGSGGVMWQVGDGLKLEGGVLSVDTADAVEEDNTRPVTSAAVYTQLGNVEALLASV